MERAIFFFSAPASAFSLSSAFTARFWHRGRSHPHPSACHPERLPPVVILSGGAKDLPSLLARAPPALSSQRADPSTSLRMTERASPTCQSASDVARRGIRKESVLVRLFFYGQRDSPTKDIPPVTSRPYNIGFSDRSP